MGRKDKNEPKNIVILVMGPIGAGKSTLINSVLRKGVMKVGRTQESLDTPGFDNTLKTDTEILESMAKWLEDSYKDDQSLLGGIIYVHDLSNDRFAGTARCNLRMFREMCGDKALGKVIITTTKWSKLSLLNYARDDTLAENRQTELKSGHWKDLLDNGASVLSFRDTYDSSWAIISKILSRLKQTELLHIYMQIQEELVDEGKLIPETAAGRELRRTLRQALEMQKQLTNIEKNSAEQESEDAEQRLAEAKEMVQLLLIQIRELKVPLSLKLKRLFGFGNRNA